MEGMLSASDKQSMVSSFLEIAVGQTAETAMQFLQVTFYFLCLFFCIYIIKFEPFFLYPRIFSMLKLVNFVSFFNLKFLMAL